MKKILYFAFLLLSACDSGHQDPKPVVKPTPKIPTNGHLCYADESTVAARFTVFKLANGQPLQWKKAALTFAIDKGLSDIFRQSFTECGRVWRAASGGGLVFTEVKPSESPDILITVMQDLKWEPYLGFTTFQLNPDSIKTAKIEINMNLYRWHKGAPYGVSPPGTPKRDVDVDGVMLHELGHALGLNHATDRASTMYPTIYPGTETIEADDIRGLRSIYGDAAK